MTGAELEKYKSVNRSLPIFEKTKVSFFSSLIRISSRSNLLNRENPTCPIFTSVPMDLDKLLATRVINLFCTQGSNNNK